MSPADRVVLAGANGFGSAHLNRLQRLQHASSGPTARLVAIADPNGGPAMGFGSDVPLFASLEEALAQVEADVVIVSTPIPSHALLAEIALRAGADVYLEKPPVATMAQFDRLLDAQRDTGRLVQVGFQSLGSHALDEMRSFGQVTSVAAWGSWVRTRAYWKRSAWAGRRELDGVPVVDGVATNPLAHAIATALAVAGARRRADVAAVDVEAFRANDIQADDTTSVRIRTAHGVVIGIGLTLCGANGKDPVVEVRTTGGNARLYYEGDEIIRGGRRWKTDRTDLFEDLLTARRTGMSPLVPLEDTSAFMTVMEAIRTAPAPSPIDATHVRWEGEEAMAHPVVVDVEHWVEAAAGSGMLFSEVGAPWAEGALRRPDSRTDVGR